MYKHSEEENISHCFTSLHFRHYFLEKSCSQKSSNTSIQLQHTIGPTSFAKNKSKVARDSGYTLGWRRQFFVALRFHQAWRMQTFLQPFHLENMHSVHVDYYLGQAYYCKIEQHRVLLTLLSPPGLTLESLFSWKLSSSVHLQDDTKALCQTGRNHLWEIYKGRLCWCCVICKKSLEEADVGHARSVWHRNPISVPPCSPCPGWQDGEELACGARCTSSLANTPVHDARLLLRKSSFLRVFRCTWILCSLGRQT